MNAPIRAELLDSEDFASQFFAPTATDLFTNLVNEYRAARMRIEEVAEFTKSPVCKSVIHYFLSGNATEERGRLSMQLSAEQMFHIDGAIAALTADYWSKALALTDVYDAMPQDRRTQWNEQIRHPEGKKKDYHEVRRDRDYHPEWFDGQGEYLDPANAYVLPPLPDFEAETVRATLTELLNNRAKFLAERVDGIFRALSGEHVTNSPAAFGKRMIIAHLITSYGTSNTDRVGYINDLRCVIAKFMGRDEPRWNSTSSVVDRARRERRGEWVTLDGGALRLRAYKCGTAHLEVHPDMAWRLNSVLAHLYPMAIPPEFRSKPKKQPKNITPIGRPLPFAVLSMLEELEPAVLLQKSAQPHREWDHVRIPNAKAFRYGATKDKFIAEEAGRVLEYLGATKVDNDRGGHYFQFDYDATDAISEVICSGCLPDRKAHQYYPTPASLAQIAVDAAQIGEGHLCLEPSAGTGALASLMPVDRTECVEISALHAKVLEAKGYKVAQKDFLQMTAPEAFDRVVMNPPFSDGRWQAHLEHAAAMVKRGGRLVAILPSGARHKDVLGAGWTCSWSSLYDNEFAGTSVSVVILVADRSSWFFGSSRR